MRGYKKLLQVAWMGCCIEDAFQEMHDAGIKDS